MKNKECMAMILAGGQGSRLGVLTHTLAKTAVQFGGKYRIIDFPPPSYKLRSFRYRYGRGSYSV